MWKSGGQAKAGWCDLPRLLQTSPTYNPGKKKPPQNYLNYIKESVVSWLEFIFDFQTCSR